MREALFLLSSFINFSPTSPPSLHLHPHLHLRLNHHFNHLLHPLLHLNLIIINLRFTLPLLPLSFTFILTRQTLVSSFEK